MPALEMVAVAVEQVESRGQWWVVSGAGCVGVMQICPRWTTRTRAELLDPEVNRAEGRRQLGNWYTKAHHNWHRALAAYNCGTVGLKGECGHSYAVKVLALAKTLEERVEESALPEDSATVSQDYSQEAPVFPLAQVTTPVEATLTAAAETGVDVNQITKLANGNPLMALILMAGGVLGGGVGGRLGGGRLRRRGGRLVARRASLPAPLRRAALCSRGRRASREQRDEARKHEPHG